jgi:Tol biopolymer transport system component
MKMKHRVLFLSLIIALILGLIGGAMPAQAQESLDTVLARAAARGFLVSLTRPELAGITDFYLLDSPNQSGLAAQLPAVTGYEIISGEWISDVTYQVKAVLQPGDREIAVYTGKYDGRWQVESLDLPNGDTVSPLETASQTGAVATSGPIPVRSNGGGQLVFQTQNGGDIYIINADGTGLRRITSGLDPQLSPDGARIAFTRWEPRYELFTINIDGSGEQAWSQNWRQMKSPTWSADGSKLIFSWQSGGRLEAEERRINLAKAARDMALDDDPIDIPDNAIGFETKDGILKFTIPADAYWSLKQVDLNTGHLIDLPTERHSYGPTGHPNQANLVIYRGNQGLALHDLDTGTDQVITADSRDHTPIISPDGSKIAVSYWQDDHWEIHTMNIDGTGRQRLTSTPLTVLVENRPLTSELVAGKERFVASETPAWNHAAPVWSPDGSQLAFVTDRNGQSPEGTSWEIWIMNADGSNQRPMFPNGALDGLTLNYNGVDERMLSWR